MLYNKNRNKKFYSVNLYRLGNENEIKISPFFGKRKINNNSEIGIIYINIKECKTVKKDRLSNKIFRLYQQ